MPIFKQKRVEPATTEKVTVHGTTSGSPVSLSRQMKRKLSSRKSKEFFDPLPPMPKNKRTENNNNNQEVRRVSFSHVEVREYRRVVTAAPYDTCCDVPLGIGWEYKTHEIEPLDTYEKRRKSHRKSKRRSGKCLSNKEKKQLLLNTGELTELYRFFIEVRKQELEDKARGISKKSSSSDPMSEISPNLALEIAFFGEDGL